MSSLFFLTFRENPYLSPAVRVQTDRGQTVVSTGPYHYVRLPMYAAVIPYALCTTLLLRSWYGLLLGLTLVVGIVPRALLEERTLRAELPGNDAYMAQVKYRLVPHLWWQRQHRFITRDTSRGPTTGCILLEGDRCAGIR